MTISELVVECLSRDVESDSLELRAESCLVAIMTIYGIPIWDTGGMVDRSSCGPRYTVQARIADKGVRMVEAAVAEKLGWIFREQFRSDLGIDAQVEIVGGGKGTGRLLALQIKCGLSWFREEVDGGWLYRGEQKHLAYWIGHSLPVLVCLCNPETGEVFWVQITEANIVRTSAGWTVKVPEDQQLNAGASDTLVRIAGSPQHADIVELLIPQYLQERYSRNIYVHPILETPHDFHGLAYMATLSGRTVFVDFIYTPMEALDIEAVSRRVEWRAYNEQAARMGDSHLHILVVGDSAQLVGIDRKLTAYLKSLRDVEVTRLIYSPIPPFELHEIDEEGRIVSYGPGGETITYGTNSLP